MDMTAPLFVDGFIPRHEIEELQSAGAAGEITSWIYDDTGQVIDCAFNRRVASAPLAVAADRRITAIAVGPSKVRAIKAALKGHLINGLITNEATAESILGS